MRISRKAIALYVALSIVLISSAIAITQVVYVLEIRDLTEGKTIMRVLTSPGDRFEMSYIHSIYGGLVHEIYNIDEDYKIVMVEATFEKEMACVYCFPDKKYDIVDSLVRVRDLGMKFEHITIRFSTTSGRVINHRGSTITLSQYSKHGDLVEIDVRRTHNIALVFDNLLKLGRDR